MTTTNETTAAPAADIPRDVHDMHRGQLEAEVVRLRGERDALHEVIGYVADDVCGLQPADADRESLVHLIARVAHEERLEARQLEARLSRDAAQLAENLANVQARCTELLLENRELKSQLTDTLAAALESSGLLLPGWTCPDCRTFNGEAKERLLICRACTTPRPTGAQSCAGGIVESTLPNGVA